MQAKQGDGARRSVCDVLEYLITIPEVKEAIKKDGSKIKLRFAADGRRTSKRIGTVMAVFNILCENKATYARKKVLYYLFQHLPKPLTEKCAKCITVLSRKVIAV